MTAPRKPQIVRLELIYQRKTATGIRQHWELEVFTPGSHRVTFRSASSIAEARAVVREMARRGCDLLDVPV